MTEQNITIQVENNYKISATLREPKNERKGIIQIHSGLGIPQEFYSNFAIFLTKNGYTTLTFDYRGIGKSKPKTLKGFDATLRDFGYKDMTGVFTWVIENYPNDKKIIVAHSMGGQLIGLMKNNEKIDQLFLIGASTGYWKDMTKPYNWKVFPIWYLFVPISTFLFGYAVSKRIKQGEDLPKRVALEWKKWCTNPNYFENEFGKTLSPLYFDKITIPIKSIQISDDPIANKITSNKLLKYYKNAEIFIDRISTKELNVKKIGHFGFFSRKFKQTLWFKLIRDIDNLKFSH
jgi:predicted alpha/beta hydrolase